VPSGHPDRTSLLQLPQGRNAGSAQILQELDMEPTRSRFIPDLL
jgi:hypothetical protein